MPAFKDVYAAVITPRHENGELNIESYRNQLQSLNGKGLVGYAINGATGEFPRTTEPELERLLNATREASPEAQIFCSVGANDAHGAIRRAKLAASAGAKAILLPMPCFFPYSQDDLKAFVLAVASEAELPILLYNLPQFTSGLEVDTVLTLFKHQTNIVGIKDSSGSLDILRAITKANLPVARLVGHDGVFCDALAENLCDGVVSGLACVIPELITSIFTAGLYREVPSHARGQLEEFIHHIRSLPTPWGLKATSHARGYTEMTYPFPLAPDRKKEIESLQNWFTKWHPKTLTTP